MKQKIVIKARIHCEKCKIKAMRTVAKASSGVISVEVKGDEVVIQGDGVDSTLLTSALRKKLGWANIVSVEVEKQEQEQKQDLKPPPPTTVIPIPYPYYPPYSTLYHEFYVGETQNPNLCYIL